LPEPLVFIPRRGEFLAQVVIIGPQALAELSDLIYFLFQRFEFRIHRNTIEAKILTSQLVTVIFECVLYERIQRFRPAIGEASTPMTESWRPVETEGARKPPRHAIGDHNACGLIEYDGVLARRPIRK
jgi:hypothetical protein